MDIQNTTSQDIPTAPVTDGSATQPLNQIPTSKKWVKIILISVILLLVTGILAYAGYQYFNKKSLTKNNQGINNQSTQPTGINSKVPTNSVIQTANVEWLPSPQKVESVGFFKAVDKYYPYRLKYCKSGTDCAKLSEMTDQYEPKTTYYLVGKMKTSYPGANVYLTITKGLPTIHVFKSVGTEKDIVYDGEMLALFIKTQDGKFIVTNDYQNDTILCGGFCNQNQNPPSNEASGITYTKDLSLEKVGTGYESTNTGYEYTDSGTGIKFSVSRTSSFFNPTGLYLVKDLGEGYLLYSNQDIHSNLIKLRTIVHPTFVMKLPTGLAANVLLGLYNYGLVFQKGKSNYSPYSDTLQLNWTAADKPKPLPKEPSDKGMVTDYTAIIYTSEYDGCRGTLTLEGVASDTEALDLTNNLVQVATTDKGDSIYEIKNKDFQIYEQFWLAKVAYNGLNDALTYNDYLALKPILIWKNSLGVYRMVFREDLVSSKCWGEPLIYLYPEKPTNVSIKLSNAINLTESEPRYTNGWEVTAYPDGKLFSKNANRYYPYLYWEGSAPVGSQPVSSSVVKQSDVHNLLVDQLTKLGLNNKEKQDFMNAWEPKLKDSPYYLISFYDAKTLDKIIPLSISPKPTTSIRILMTYERLNEKIEVQNISSSNYQTPQRNGFTLVEWGGILHNPTKN